MTAHKRVILSGYFTEIILNKVGAVKLISNLLHCD